MDDAVVQLVQTLVQAGAVPGVDFSCDPQQQALWLTQRCVDLLQDCYPEIDWATFLAPFLDRQTDLIDSIHQQLGCRFVELLVGRMVIRCQSLSDPQATWYLQQILMGVEQRTGLCLWPLLEPLLLAEERLRLEWLLQQDAQEPSPYFLYDLVLAAGGTEDDISLTGSDVWLSEVGRQRLELIWASPAEIKLEVPTQAQ